MTRFVARVGYERTSLKKLLEHAKVARATFYRQFADKHDCLLGAQRHCQEELVRAVISAKGSPWAALAAFAQSRPDAIGLIADPPLLGDQGVLSEHERARREIAAAILASDPSLQDLPIGVLSGGAMRVLASRARQPDFNAQAIAAHIALWVSSYQTGGARLTQLCQATPLPALLDQPSPASTTIEQGEPQSSRPKILRALLDEADQCRGPMTVGQLATAAGLTRETFYGHFPDRGAAIKRLRQIVSSDLIALCMRAFVAHQQWPEQIWHTGHALLSFLDEHPRLTRFLLSGPLQEPGEDSDDCLNAFAVFLSPGLERLDDRPSDLYSQLILASEVELLFSGMRTSKPLRSRHGWLAFLALAPVMGGDKTTDFLAAQFEQMT
jgi:AcrR family transcriptional regulator